MTTETRRRIRAYKKALPELRERVIAVALLLAMSVSMLASASFAWITLSAAPEVSGMQTTVAANGNLEIALAHGPTSKEEDGIMVNANAIKPEESAVGDSSAAEDQSIVGANVTWGNLVNVSDPTYGLSNIALRPALLSERNININPLYGATYGGDGRVIGTSEKYEFATYKDFGNDNFRFVAGKDTQYGVRAIVSTTSENVAGNVALQQYEEETNGLYSSIAETYGKMVDSDGEYIQTLEGLVTVYVNDMISNSDSDCSAYVYDLYLMLLEMKDMFDAEGQALLNMANAQAYLASEDNNTNTFEDIDDLKSKVSSLADYGVTLTTLAGHIADYNSLLSAINAIKDYADKCAPDSTTTITVTFGQLYEGLQYLMDFDAIYIGGKPITELKAEVKKDPLGTLRKVNNSTISITQGLLKNFEQRVIDKDARMSAKVEIKVLITIKGTVVTNATGSPERYVDIETSFPLDAGKNSKVRSGASGSGDEIVAKDTYGFAIDLWARTNYPQAVLTLEGSPEYSKVNVKGKDQNGNAVDLFTLTVENVETDVYSKNGEWYFAKNHEKVPAEYLDGNAPIQQQEEIMIGFQGANRIWADWDNMMDLGYINKDSITQGAGSCFVFYADPTDEDKILELLDAFSIVFIDQDGEELGTAILNTGLAYANQGKVTVPLQMESGTKYVDEENISQIGITTLMANRPTRVTAIVYINGRNLENRNVLAAGKIQGQLNIQFGTNATLIAPDNEELQNMYRTITAEVTVGGEKTTDKKAPINLEYRENGYTAQVKLMVEGEQPEKISGFFIRQVNDTQGIRDEEREFTPNGDGTWTAEFTLTNPGTYVLNSVVADGIQYMLHDGSDEDRPANHPAVYIDGLSLGTVKTDVNSGTYISVDGTFPVEVTAEIDSVIKPQRVMAFFSGDNRQFTASMSYNSDSGKWVGTANINASGTYTLSYITVDGTSLPINTDNPTTLTLYLGMQVTVRTDEGVGNAPLQDADGDGETDVVTFPVTVTVKSGNQMMTNLKNVKLYYHNAKVSAFDKDGMEATLQLSGNSYTGFLATNKAGEYTFNRLVVTIEGKSGPLDKLSNIAPTFIAYNPDPPEYVGTNAVDYQTAFSAPAEYKVTLMNALGARVVGNFERTDGSGETLIVETSVNEKSETEDALDYVFALNDDGVWKLTNIKVNTIYGTEFEFTVNDGVSTKVVKTINTNVISQYNLSKPVELNGAFMGNMNTGELQILVTDYAGDPIQGLEGATWFFEHVVEKMVDGKWTNIQKMYGGYTDLDGYPVAYNGGEFNLEMDVQADGITVSGTEYLPYAGEYESSLKLKFEDGRTYPLSVEPVFVVKSTKPTATITGISPTSSVPTKITWVMGQNGCDTDKPFFSTTANQTGSFTEYRATVYAKANAESSNYHTGTFTQPSVSVTIGGVGNDWTVNMTLPGSSDEKVSDITQTVTGSGKLTFTLGAKETIKSWQSDGLGGIVGGALGYSHYLEAYYGHGTVEIEEMQITRGTLSLKVVLDNKLIIENPDSINQTS